METLVPVTFLAALTLAANLANAQEVPLPLRLVERTPQVAPVRPVAAAAAMAAWPTDFATAAGITKQRQVLQLLMFTAKW